MRTYRVPGRARCLPVFVAICACFLLLACDDDTVDDGGDTIDVTVPEEVVGGGEDVAAGEDVASTPCECPPDERLCTQDECDENDVCQHEEMASTGNDLLGFDVPDFTLTDVNPESATNGDSFTLSEVTADGMVAVLLFHDAECESCREQGEAARSWYEGIQASGGVWVATVNTAAAADSVADYVNADEPTVDGPAPPSTWAVLQDTDTEDVWERFCADTDWVLVVDLAGNVAYMRQVNFDDDFFANELTEAVVHAKTLLPE